MRVLVTGGAGFIGSNFVRRIVDGTLKGIGSVVVLDKLTYSGSLDNLSEVPQEDFEFVHGDICDRDLMLRLSKNCDAIINFAAESHVDRSISSSREFVESNIVGVNSLLTTLLETGVSTFIQVSTDEVYGSIASGSATEENPIVPNSPYSASKASADLLCKSFFITHGLDIRITRCSNNYGPYQYPEKVIPLFITNLLEGKKLPLYGNGENRRDWLHVDDHCLGIHKVLTSGTPGNIYNLGGGRELRNLDLAMLILNYFDKDDSWIEWVKDRPGHDFRYAVNYQKAANELNYAPMLEFDKEIENVISWYVNHENWWRKRKIQKAS